MPRSPLKTIKDLVDLSPAKWHSLDLRKSCKKTRSSPLDVAMVFQRYFIETSVFLSIFHREREFDVAEYDNFFFVISNHQIANWPFASLRTQNNPRIPGSENLFGLDDRSLGLVQLLSHKLKV